MRAVNLLPREEIRQRREAPRREIRIAIAVPLVALVIVLVGGYFTGSRVSGNRAKLRALEAELASLPRPKPGPQVDPALRAQRDQRVAALAEALDGRLAWDRILRHVSSILPEDVWLAKLTSSSSAQAAPTPAPPPPTTTTTTSSTDTTAAAPRLPSRRR